MDNAYNRIARRRSRGQGGFTLIELLVVIAVLAILAGIVLFNVVGVANRGQASACSTDVKTFQTAVDTAINDQLSGGGTTAGSLTAGTMIPADLQALNTGNYIHDAAGTTACTTLTLTFVGGGWQGGATVAGS